MRYKTINSSKIATLSIWQFLNNICIMDVKMHNNLFEQIMRRAWVCHPDSLAMPQGPELDQCNSELKQLFQTILHDSVNSAEYARQLEAVWMEAKNFTSFRYPYKLRVQYPDGKHDIFVAYITTSTKHLVLRDERGMITLWPNMHWQAKKQIVDCVYNDEKPEYYPQDLYRFFIDLFNEEY